MSMKNYILPLYTIYTAHMWFSETHFMWIITMLLSINQYRQTTLITLLSSINCHLKNFIHYRRTVELTLRLHLNSTNRPSSVHQAHVPKMSMSSGRSFLALFYMSVCYTAVSFAELEKWRNFYIFVIGLVHILDRLFNYIFSSYIMFFSFIYALILCNILHE